MYHAHDMSQGPSWETTPGAGPAPMQPLPILVMSGSPGGFGFF
jgi:hypothetical protein